MLGLLSEGIRTLKLNLYTSTLLLRCIHQLWNFAQKINANNMEIIVSERILICHCSDDDLAMVTQYGGEIKEREPDQTTSAQRNN